MGHNFTCVWETLERRLLFCALHTLTPEIAAYLNSLPADSPAPFDFAHSIPQPAGTTGSGPEAAPFTTILNNGPSSNRVDITIVGDGYRSVDLPTYNVHAANTVASFFNQSPLNIYKPLFNVHRVDVVSNESGVDNDPVQGIQRDTAMDMGFWCNGIERLLCINTSDAQTFAASAPQTEQILAIANSTMYGGAGYSAQNLGTFSGGNSSALEVALHEFGHAFADLADEYEYGGPTIYTGGEPAEANVSIHTAANMAALQAKWWRWLDEPEVDTFEGAYYSELGIYRPTFDSKMRSLFRPFEQVNTEQLIINVYKTVRPIDSATPPGAHPSTTTFAVNPVDPVGNPLSVQWLIDGVPVESPTRLRFNPGSLNLSGTHTLSVRVTDETPLVRDPVARSTWMTQTRSWTLLDAIAPAVSSASFEVDQPSMQAKVTFSEDVGPSLSIADLVLENLTTSSTIPSENIALSYDALTRTATFTFPGYENGILPDGNYLATLPAGSIRDAAGNALAQDFTFNFFFLNGDANRDATVNVADYNILAANYGQEPRTFTQGDFNYDGRVNLADYNILAARYGLSLGAQDDDELLGLLR